jgi:hypothetical protein
MDLRLAMKFEAPVAVAQALFLVPDYSVFPSIRLGQYRIDALRYQS